MNNEIYDTENTNFSQISTKPLDVLITDIKSRNNKVPDTKEEKTKENGNSTDDLYHKILKESHNMRKEILSKNKLNSTNLKYNPNEENENSYNHEAASILSRNIKRALIFQSTENMNKDSKNDNKDGSEILSPIVKKSEEPKSEFGTLNKLCIGTDIKTGRKEKMEEILEQTSNQGVVYENIEKKNLKRDKQFNDLNLNNDNNLTSKHNINYNDYVQHANTPTNKPITMNNVKETKIKFHQNSQTQTQAVTKTMTHPEKTNDKLSTIKKQNITVSKSRYPNSYQSPIVDFQMLYLINNCKEIEKIIEKEKPIQKIEKIEEKVVKNMKVVDEIKQDELEMIETKQEMDIKLQEVKSLFRLYGEKLENMEVFVNKLNKDNPKLNECEKCQNRIAEEELVHNKSSNEYNYTFENFFKNHSLKNSKLSEHITFSNHNNRIVSEQVCSFQINKEKSNLKTVSERPSENQSGEIESDLRKLMREEDNENENEIKEEYTTNTNINNLTSINKAYKHGKNKIYNFINDRKDFKNEINHSSSQSKSDNFSSSGNSKNFACISQKVNEHLSNGEIKEAVDTWKKINFSPLDNCSFERSYEMLAQILKIKDRENETIIRKIFNLENLKEETKKKDTEIVQLFAQLEYFRNKSQRLESECLEVERLKTRNTNFINENSLLYKENVRLKMLLKEAELQNMKTNSQAFLSTNNSLNFDNYNSNSNYRKNLIFN